MPEDFYREVEPEETRSQARSTTPLQKALWPRSALDFDDLLLQPVDLCDTVEPVREGTASFQLRDDRRVSGHQPAQYLCFSASLHARTCAWSATKISPSTAGAAPTSKTFSTSRRTTGSAIIRLEQNYRSTKTILEAADAMIANNSRRKDKKLWTDAPAAGDRLLRAGDDGDEAELIARTYDRGVSTTTSGANGGLLSHQRPVAEDRRSGATRGRAYTMVDGLRYYNRDEIKDVLATCRSWSTRRRRQPVARHQHARARHRQGRDGRAGSGRARPGRRRPRRAALLGARARTTGRRRSGRSW